VIVCGCSVRFEGCYQVSKTHVSTHAVHARYQVTCICILINALSTSYVLLKYKYRKVITYMYLHKLHLMFICMNACTTGTYMYLYLLFTF
jgi:hypothetical protein